MKNLLIASDSDHDANMLYAVGMFVPDPFVYLRIKGRSHVVMNDLEIDRVRREAPHCRVISLSLCRQKLRRQRVKADGLARVIRLVLRYKQARRHSVSD